MIIDAYSPDCPERLLDAIRVKAADDEAPTDMVRGTALGHVSRQTAALITVHHDEDYPSVLLVPVTRGNLLGTFASGGVLGQARETVPVAKIARQKAAPGLPRDSGPGGHSAARASSRWTGWRRQP